MFDFLQDVNPKMQRTGQTGGGETRLTLCGPRSVVTTERNGVPPSGSYLGPHPLWCNKAVCRCAVCSEFHRSFNSCQSQEYRLSRKKTENRCLTILEVPVERLVAPGRTKKTRSRCVVWDLAEVEAWLRSRRQPGGDDVVRKAPVPDFRMRKSGPSRKTG